MQKLSFIPSWGAALLILFSFFSCSDSTTNTSEGQENQSKPKSIPLPPPATGMIHHSFTVAAEPSQTYAIYIPSNYTAEQSWPVIYCFDPQGKGNMPVKKYKDLAEVRGYVLVGSNSTQNGMDFGVSEGIAAYMMSDVQERLNIDPQRVYTAGFSGGARIATRHAQVRGGISGVWACSGGFPSQDYSTSQDFAVFGTAGNADFNYQEMMALDQALDNTRIPHWIQTFEGIHEWPPVNTFEDGLNWFELRAMAEGQIPKNDSLIAVITENLDSDINSTSSWSKMRALQKKVLFLDELTDLTADITAIGKMESSIGINFHKEQESELAAREFELRNEFANEIPMKGLDWWRPESKKLQQKAQLKTPEGNMYARVLQFLSLNSYMYASQAVNQQDFENAEKFLTIYMLVDPANPEHRYLTAQLRVLQGNFPEGMMELQTAVALGFEDFERLKADPILNQLSDDPQYMPLLEELRRKQYGEEK